mmetsp:Transcript_38576/g.65677  ORF Transcript_38576/g.65677 Transcript_38576/m.65677 type:complete len:452 (-) Transcript_38576:51-1406(-)
MSQEEHLPEHLRTTTNDDYDDALCAMLARYERADLRMGGYTWSRADKQRVGVASKYVDWEAVANEYFEFHGRESFEENDDDKKPWIEDYNSGCELNLDEGGNPYYEQEKCAREKWQIAFDTMESKYLKRWVSTQLQVKALTLVQLVASADVFHGLCLARQNGGTLCLPSLRRLAVLSMYGTRMDADSRYSKMAWEVIGGTDFMTEFEQMVPELRRLEISSSYVQHAEGNALRHSKLEYIALELGSGGAFNFTKESVIWEAWFPRLQKLHVSALILDLPVETKLPPMTWKPNRYHRPAKRAHTDQVATMVYEQLEGPFDVLAQVFAQVDVGPYVFSYLVVNQMPAVTCRAMHLCAKVCLERGAVTSLPNRPAVTSVSQIVHVHSSSGRFLSLTKIPAGLVHGLCVAPFEHRLGIDPEANCDNCDCLQPYPEWEGGLIPGEVGSLYAKDGTIF